jgi:hypothetical protein
MRALETPLLAAGLSLYIQGRIPRPKQAFLKEIVFGFHGIQDSLSLFNRHHHPISAFPQQRKYRLPRLHV